MVTSLSWQICTFALIIGGLIPDCRLHVSQNCIIYGSIVTFGLLQLVVYSVLQSPIVFRIGLRKAKRIVGVNSKNRIMSRVLGKKRINHQSLAYNHSSSFIYVHRHVFIIQHQSTFIGGWMLSHLQLCNTTVQSSYYAWHCFALGLPASECADQHRVYVQRFPACGCVHHYVQGFEVCVEDQM